MREENVGSGWTAGEWAQWFKQAYREVLRLSPDALTQEGGYWVQDALEVYRLLNTEARGMLEEEGAKLEALAGAVKSAVSVGGGGNSLLDKELDRFFADCGNR